MDGPVDDPLDFGISKKLEAVPIAYNFLRSIKDHPEIIRNTLLLSPSNRPRVPAQPLGGGLVPEDYDQIFPENLSQVPSLRVIDASIYWTKEGIQLLKDIFKNHPQMLFEVALLSNHLFDAAANHAVEYVTVVLEEYSDMPNLIKAMMNRTNAEGQSLGVMAASQINNKFRNGLSVTTLVEFIEASAGYIPFPIEELPRMLTRREISNTHFIGLQAAIRADHARRDREPIPVSDKSPKGKNIKLY